MPKPLPKKAKFVPGAERSLTVSLKSLRNPPLNITLRAVPLSTSILSLKESVSSEISLPVPQIRLLFKKKPATDSKTLKDLVGDHDAKVEFSIMVIGGGTAATQGTEVEKGLELVTMGSGKEVLKTEAFWGDLKGFLVQRLKDEAEGEQLWEVFKKAAS